MVRRGRKDAQIVILVKPELQADLDTIRIVTATSRARVVEPMLAYAVAVDLAELETNGLLARVVALAERAGVTVREYATAYGKAFSKHAYGPGLDSLEADDRIVTQHIVRTPAPATAVAG